MNRELKFRGWSDGLFGKGMHYGWGCFTNESSKQFLLADGDRIMVNVLMQFTGLKDKSEPCKDVYEGDIIDTNGKITGDTYQMDVRETDLVIKGLGTASWSETEKAGLARGFRYSE